MTMAEAGDILGFWTESPPVYVTVVRLEAMFASWLGLKPRNRSPEMPSATPKRVGEIMAEMPRGAFAERDVHEGLGETVVLDFAALKARAAAARARIEG